MIPYCNVVISWRRLCIVFVWLFFLTSVYDGWPLLYQYLNWKVSAIFSEKLNVSKSLPSRIKMMSSTSYAHIPVVLYNRVEKCGSSGIIWLVKRQELKMHFRLIDISLPQLKQYGDRNSQAEMVLYMKNLQKNSFVVRHLHFLHFQKFNSPWPSYINVIRNPVERFISFYYYIRNGFTMQRGRSRGLWKRNITAVQENMSLDDCMEKDPLGCVRNSTPTFLAFFCGQEEQCREYSTSYPLRQAKSNVIRHYLAIGLTEDMENTVKIFSAVLPTFFAGAQAKSMRKVSSRYKTYRLPEVKNHTRSLLRKVLHYEIDFYEFVKIRFYKQLADMIRKQKISADDDDI